MLPDPRGPSTSEHSAEAVLRIWEQGRREHPVDRALTTLSVLSGRSRRELAELPVEERDRQLLARRAALFGPTLAAAAACASCGCLVDVTVRAGDTAPGAARVHVALDGAAAVEVRMPTSVDLAAIAGCADIDAARAALLRRLIDVEDPSEALLLAAEQELDRRAGVSGGLVEVACPDCGALWSVELDVAAFLWRELEIQAGRLLRDVDVLARRYGWSERDILALAPDRRRFYLELAS
jgi:hypothetical protein